MAYSSPDVTIGVARLDRGIRPQALVDPNTSRGLYLGPDGRTKNGSLVTGSRVYALLPDVVSLDGYIIALGTF